MKIREVEVDFDFLDADNMEKFEKYAQKVKDTCDRREKEEMPMSQAIREECEIIDEFFDKVFGEGVANKIFKGKKNLMEHVNAFADIVDEKIKQQKSIESMYDRYQPNREQKRYEQHYKNRNNNGKYSAR